MFPKRKKQSEIIAEKEQRIMSNFNKVCGQLGVELNEAPSANDPKIEKFIMGLNQLIQSAVDEDGDPLPVVDKSGTWEEPEIYLPIEYRNGALIIKKRSQMSNDIQQEIILKRNMEFDGIPTLKLIRKLYTAALKRRDGQRGI